MPSTAMSWDGYGGQIFPAAMSFHHHHQDTLEAVFQQPESTAPLQAPEAAGERELLLRNGSPVPASVDAGGGVHAAGARRKRPFRTDRHSKIRTAQGVRDRRIRLSVPCAREFFALQDLLRFDKPSETLNWLFTQAKPAIDRLGDAAEPAGVVSGAPPTVVVVKGRGEGSSSSTCCLTAANSREEATEKGRSRGGGGPHGPTALMEEQGGGELGWIMTEDTAAAAVTAEQPQQMDALDYYYLYCQQLEEMAAMRCNGGTPR